MARYYEESALLEFVKKYTPTISGETTMKCVERAIRNSPTADVVPRAEVDELKKERDEYKKHVDEDIIYVHRIKEEVAREIFEEIDGWFRYCERYGGNVIKIRLAELKKKYTEGKE